MDRVFVAYPFILRLECPRTESTEKRQIFLGFTCTVHTVNGLARRFFPCHPTSTSTAITTKGRGFTAATAGRHCVSCGCSAFRRSNRGDDGTSSTLSGLRPSAIWDAFVERLNINGSLHCRQFNSFLLVRLCKVYRQRRLRQLIGVICLLLEVFQTILRQLCLQSAIALA